jgi:7-cyano-7-deazaguanine synthase
MCFIGGCLVLEGGSAKASPIERILKNLIRIGGARGTDGAGFAVIGRTHNVERDLAGPGALGERLSMTPDVRAVLLNARLEPTCEYIPDPRTADLQPYVFGGLTVVHNGIIANDESLRQQHGIALDDVASAVDSAILPHVLHRMGGVSKDTLRRLAQELEGSYALAVHDAGQPDRLYLACSYKPLWTAYAAALHAFFFASEPEMIVEAIAGSVDVQVQRLRPYSGLVIDSGRRTESFDLDFRSGGGPALCVCSGGMDSTTAAAMLRQRGEPIVLCHFLYGCKAEAREERAVRKIAKHYNVDALFVPLPWLGELGGSSLTVPNLPIADGNTGVEKPHEWVPARNLLMIAHAVALCERHGYGRVVLGLNEQEGEVFPDNEMEFLTNLQMAVHIGSPSRIDLEAPLARMSKRDILRTALALEVPLHLTWSCYRSGRQPCGTCGSCLQRRVAFLQLGQRDFLEYERDFPASVGSEPSSLERGTHT